MDGWSVYIVRCADGSLYTGIARDVERRVSEHNADDRLGARYTRARRPVTLEYREEREDRADAARRESEIKGYDRARKEQLIAAANGS